MRLTVTLTYPPTGAKTRAADRAQHADEHHRFIQNEIWGRK